MRSNARLCNLITLTQGSGSVSMSLGASLSLYLLLRLLPLVALDLLQLLGMSVPGSQSSASLSYRCLQADLHLRGLRSSNAFG